MEIMIVKYVVEILMGLFIIIFSLALRSWFNSSKETDEQILKKLTTLTSEFHDYRVNTEHRVTEVEEKVHNLEKVIFLQILPNQNNQPKG